MSNTALSFDAANTAYAAADPAGLPTGAAAWTLALWYRRAGIPPVTDVLLFRGYPATGNDAVLYLDSAGELHLYSTGTALGVTDAAVTADGEWHLAIATYDGTTGRLYRDDPTNEIGHGDCTLDLDNPNPSLYVGAWFGFQYYLTGDVDEVLVYDHALSDADRAALWGGGSGTATPPATGLVRWYPCDEGTGDSAADSAGSGHPLTLSGVTWTTGSPTPTPAATKLIITSAPPSSVEAGATFGMEVSAETDADAVDTSYTGDVTIALASNPGPGTLGGTLTHPAVSGVATFPGLSIDVPASGYTIGASGDSLTPATSEPITVTSPTPTPSPTPGTGDAAAWGGYHAPHGPRLPFTLFGG